MIAKFIKLYDWAFRPHFYRGARAEVIFEAICKSGGLIPVKIQQDQASFQVQKNAGHEDAKRGDFTIRNRRNAEVEVKCLKVRVENRTKGYFVAYHHIKRHSNSAKMTQTPIYFAFLAPKGERSVDPHSLKMIGLDSLDVRKGVERIGGIKYVEKPAKGLFIPLEALTPGLTLLDEQK